MRILAIDPGYERSAWLVLADGRPVDMGIDDNEDLRWSLRIGELSHDVMVVEKVESYGMAVGREVFDTVFWAGRLTEAAIGPDRGDGVRVVQLPRRAVKLHLCQSARAKDANIRAALLDRFGGSAAKGTKARPGPLYGVSGDLWSALAVAVTYADTPGAWS